MSQSFTPVRVGRYTLPNRLVMAPMTRSRAKFDGTPGELAAEYYSQRASLGLIVTEGSQPSDDGRATSRRRASTASAQGLGRRPPFRAPHRRRAARWLDCTDVGGVANEVATRARRPMFHRSLEANSGGNGRSAETAGHQEEGETVGENLAGRRCFYREKRRIRELPKTPERLKHRFPNYPRSSKALRCTRPPSVRPCQHQLSYMPSHSQFRKDKNYTLRT